MTADNIVAICSKKLTGIAAQLSGLQEGAVGHRLLSAPVPPYVWGRTDLVIFTDHKPLTYMFESNELSFALQQWLDVILDYRFEIHYRPGILNVVPDALSRMYSASVRGHCVGRAEGAVHRHRCTT